MIKERKHSHQSALNRQKAEKLLIGDKSTKAVPQTEAAILKLIHELDVHRVELEMQNEELRMARDKAESAIEKFTRVYDFAPAGYFTVSQDGTIYELNLTGAGMLGMQRSALVNKSFRQFFKQETWTVFNAFLQKLWKTRSKQVCELKLKPNRALSIFVHLEGIVYDKNQHCNLTVIDITKRRIAEEALKESEAHLRELNATKDKFFSIISHDLRSPFSSIIGYSNVLAEQIVNKNYEGIGEYARIIQESSWRVMDLLLNLFEWSRTQNGNLVFNPESIEIAALIREAAALSYAAAEQKSMTIYLDLPGNVVAFADKEMISTVLRNLISNAIKFTHPNGLIAVSARENNIETIVSVKDSGIGMTQNAIEKLFRIEESCSTMGTWNELGTGLGLLLCKEFISKNGGEIWVESEQGKGSEFHFTIPKHQEMHYDPK
jgi:PAS domain S-box-containing protein